MKYYIVSFGKIIHSFHLNENGCYENVFAIRSDRCNDVYTVAAGKQANMPELFLSNPPDFSYLTRNSCPEAYKGDTAVNLHIFNFNPLEVKLPGYQKKMLIKKAFKTTFLESQEYRYLSDQYWKWDTLNNDFVRVNCTTCCYDDFYFKDLDGDGDLDIIYSSLLNDYLNADSNGLLLFRNENGKYTLHRISGFVQDADFTFQHKGYIIFNMVHAPCCEEICYHFSVDTFSVKKWTSTSKKVIAIGNNDVKLIYPSKDYL